MNSESSNIDRVARPPLWSRFGFRLTVAIVGIVAFITLGLLALVQNQFNAAYREFIEDRFTDEIQAFEEQFNLRRNGIERNVQNAVLAVRPQVALEVGDAGRAYSDYRFELDDLFTSGRIDINPVFFRVFDSERSMLAPPEGNAGTVQGLDEATLASMLQPYLPEVSEESWYSLGYLSFPTSESPTLYEMFIAPVVDDYYGQLRGWLVVGVKLGRGSLGTPSRSIESGIYADGQLFSPSLPMTLTAEIRRNLRVAKSGPVVSVSGTNYLFFANPLKSSPGMPKAWRVQLYSLAALELLVGHIQSLAFILLAAALLLGFALSYFTSQSFARRIEALVVATRKIGHGDFDVHPPEGKDELGMLGRSIKVMASELALKEKMRYVLNLVTDPAVADEMLAGKIELGGETREVATLFCDIRGFTPLTDGMDPREVVELVNQHMTAMADLAEEHRGVVDKYVGDEIMVLFGAPHAYGDDWVSAVRCGLAMVEARERLNETSDRPIRIGVGIGAGEVVAGQMGSDRRRNYTVLGDRVNLAARLCSKAGPGEVIIDEAIRKRLPASAEVERIDSVQLKGFKDPVPVFKVTTVD